ncbi:MAG TPA: glycosyltransferase family 39 protein [Gemmataceae bacterium]|nr:glycosyltransferase family 39 protein [Gemmataceae bacterium]
MFRRFDRRAGHYALLLAAWAALCLPNLGAPSLWDIDEGNNSEAAREMWRAGNWIVPTCNYKLREDKPALIYWLQGAGYAAFGAGEFAARLPSALAALAAMLATYELGRRMFTASSGLLAGLLLGSAVMFCAAAHFANPDSLLNACSLFALFFFWRDYAAGRRGWSAWSGAAAGFGVLAKGPVGLILPAAVVLLFLLWRWELRRLWSLRWLHGLLAFVLVAAPWYVWVTVETKAAWTVGFWMHHNVNRFTGALESHGGPFYYYIFALLIGCAPWCVFFGPTAGYAVRRLRERTPDAGAPDERPAVQFLLCWMAVYFLFFSASTTKLPNYILPLYPAAALLTGRFLDQWRRGQARFPAWLIGFDLACLALIGVATALGLATAGGALYPPGLQMQRFPGLQWYAGLGVPLLLGAAAAAWLLLRRSSRAGALTAVLASSLAFTAAMAGWGAVCVEAWKAPKALAAALPADQTRRDVRVATFAYYEPSLIFYCRREVPCLNSEQEALDFLEGPLPSYLFLPADQWQVVAAKAPRPYRLLAQRHDLYDNCEVVVVTNE